MDDLVSSTAATETSVCSITLATLFLQIVNEVIKSNETKRQRNYEKIKNCYDFLIVGAGSAGCVLANRLSEINDWSVLLLELGGEEPEIADVPSMEYYMMSYQNNINHIYKTVPRDDLCNGQKCDWPRGRVLGGTSVINGMMYQRGNKKNFDHWAALGNYGWDYNTVLHYFKKSENNKDKVNPYYHGFDGYLSVEKISYIDDNVKRVYQSFVNLGYNQNDDVNAESQLGVTLAQFTMDNGRRHSTNRAFLQPALKTRPNLHVITNAKVTKVLINSKIKEAYGVEYVLLNDPNKVNQVYAKKEVILSAGAIESPHILMLSGVGPKQTLNKFNIEVIKDSNVGQNLHDHLYTMAVTYDIGKYSTIPDSIDKYLEDSVEYLANQGPLTTSVPLSVVTFLKSKFASLDDPPDLKIYVMPVSSPSSNEITTLANHCSYSKINSTIYPACYYNKISFAPSLQYPKSRGNITLRSANPFDDPLIYDGFYSVYQDFEVLLDGVHKALEFKDEELFKSAGWTLSPPQSESCTSYEFDTDEYWRCITWESTQSVFHLAGTCKMGPFNDNNAVVDPELRVYGVHKLRVIDASILPLPIGGKPNAASIMIGEKGADLIKNSWHI